jgi:hypothetical protein
MFSGKPSGRNGGSFHVLHTQGGKLVGQGMCEVEQE